MVTMDSPIRFRRALLELTLTRTDLDNMTNTKDPTTR